MTLYDDAQAAAAQVVDDALAAAQAATAAVQAQLDAANAQAATLAASVSALTAKWNADEQTITTDAATIAALQAQVAALQPAVKTAVFSAYPGPIVKDQYDPAPAMPNRVAAAYGIKTLPADRVYSEGSYGLAVKSLSPVVCVSYKQVPGLAAGTTSVVAAVTAEIKALAANPKVTYYVSCDHEVDNKIKQGTYTVAQYVAAAKSFAQIVRSVNAPNVKIAVCYMGWTFTQPATSSFHPATYFDPAVCDVVALDPYWTNQASASAAFDPAWTWAKAQGKPVHVWEVGFYTAGTQPAITEDQVTQRVGDIIAYWKPKADLVLWFEANKSDGDNLLEGHPAGLSLWATAVQSK